jgi:Cytochrome c7 and related cytochrome c
MGSAAGYVDTGIKIPERPDKFMMADGRQYGTCGSCHNTGYKGNDYTRRQPYADYPNFARNDTSGALGSWVLNGIQCERCHNATGHPTDYANTKATVPSYADSTALCSQCHIRPGVWEYVVIPPNDPPAGGPANPNWATQPTAYPIGASATNFGSHLIGKQFLNSPHALFTGSFAEIADTSKYIGGFSDGGTCSNPSYTTESTCEGGGGTWTPNQGGCATCHNVHESTVAAAKENFSHEPMKNQCGIDCHSSRASVSRQRHPTGPGTPFKELAPTQTEWAESCVICHMPKPAGGTGLNAHVFRISTDPTYSTFPAAGATTPGICSNPDFATTKAACTDANAGGYCYAPDNTRLTDITTKAACESPNKWKAYTWSLVANSAPEITETGVFEQAVWVDIDLACGQCHGPGGSAHELSKPILAGYAAGMHARNSTVLSCADCHTGTTAAHPAGANTPTDCSGCHGTSRAGVIPTVQAACITCHSSTGVATHQFTEEQIKPYAEAIHAGGSAPSTTCTTCHTEVPETLIAHPDKTCTTCHSTPKPGVKPTSAQACNSCHGGSLGRRAFKSGVGPRLGAGFISKSYLAKAASTMHENLAPSASFVVEAEDVDSVLEGIQVRLDQTVGVIDTSTDQNENISSILVSWGDGTTSYMHPGGKLTHSYTTSGKRKISVTAIDLKGLKSKKVTQQVTVLK